MDQGKFVENSQKFVFFKGCLPKILLGYFVPYSSSSYTKATKCLGMKRWYSEVVIYRPVSTPNMENLVHSFT